jgi:hypothetical protein
VSAKSGLSRQGRWGVVILLGTLIFMAGLAGLPYLWYHYNKGQLGEARAEMQFIEAKLNSIKSVHRAGFSASDNIDPVFAVGSTSGTSLAGLQTLLANLAEENGVTIQRTQPLQTEAKEGLAALRMELEASGSLESLRGYLLAIEQGQPFIFINQAKISSEQAAAEEGAALPSDKLLVALQLETYGWWEKPQ